jgi:hypothetical protein
VGLIVRDHDYGNYWHDRRRSVDLGAGPSGGFGVAVF